jgi:SAM-dependent methyltransferase
VDLVEAKNGFSHTRHPWELARVAFFDRLIKKAIGGKPVRVLDVGCGDAWCARQLLRSLPPSSTLTGWDIALDDEMLAVYSDGLPPGMELTRTDPQGLFDLILCMDVIEHVPDDVELLSDLFERFLVPGGQLLCTVPAWPALFSKHDVSLKHFRRYTPAMGVKALTAAGLKVRTKGGLFHSLAIVRKLQVARGDRAAPLDDPLTVPESNEPVGLANWNAPELVTRLVTGVLTAEGLLSAALSRAGIELPGLSWWALCEKA